MHALYLLWLHVPWSRVLWLYLLYYDKQVAALYAHLRHQTKAYGTIEGLDQVDLRTLCATKVNPSAKVINMPKTHIEDRDELEHWVPGMASRRSARIASLEDWQLDLLPAPATEGRGRTHELQQDLVREASERAPLSETWGAHRQAQTTPLTHPLLQPLPHPLLHPLPHP